MIRVRILRATVAQGAVVGVDSLHDLPDAEAQVLLRLGKAERADGAPARTDTGVVTIDGDPQVDHREPPARRRR